jgi:HEAT repeat protein
MSHRLSIAGVWALVPAVVIALLAGCSSSESPSSPTTDVSNAPAAAHAAPSPASTPAASTAKASTTEAAKPSAKPAASQSPQRDLAARLVDGDGRGGWRLNEKAATELERQGPEAVAQLWPLLNDERVEVRRGAALYLLGQFSPHDSQQVAAFIGLLGDRDRTIRSIALSAVKELPHDQQIAALDRVVSMLNPQQEDVPENRAAVARFCGSLKADGTAATSALQAAVTSDPEAKVRAAAVAALAQVAPLNDVTATLAKALSDPESSVRLVAAARLRQLGQAAAPAAPQLAAILGDADSSTAEAAAEALVRIGSPAVGPLTGQLTGSNIAARKLALACLAKIGPAAKPATAAIEKCQQDPDAQVRQLATIALKRITGQ